MYLKGGSRTGTCNSGCALLAELTDRTTVSPNLIESLSTVSYLGTLVYVPTCRSIFNPSRHAYPGLIIDTYYIFVANFSPNGQTHQFERTSELHNEP